MTDLRQACDRCHDKKLRCPKLPGVSSCSRCAKAGAPCIYSPPTRATLAHHHAQSPLLSWSTSTDFDQINGLASHFDPSFINFSGAFPSPNPEPFQQQQQQQQEEGHGVVPPPHNGNGASDSDVTAQLAELMVGIDGICRALPGNVHHASKGDVHLWADRVRQLLDLRTNLEHILNYCQQLASLYPPALQSAVAIGSVDDACSVPDCLHGYYAKSHEADPSPSLDYALLGLLQACHLKLITAVEALVECGRFCRHVTSDIPKDREPKFDLPVARIGSFVAPTGVAASMFYSMLEELQAILAAKNRDLSSLAASVKPCLREVQVLSLQCDIIGDRTKAAMDEMNGFKKLAMS